MKVNPILLLATILGSTLIPGSQATAEFFVQNPDDRARIKQAIPSEPAVKPAHPRRLLIFTLNVGYGGHPSMAYANDAFRLMGEKTGAFETVVSADPAVFERASLRRFDAVFFNNTVGNCFTNRDLRRNLLEFITAGGGLMGVHGTAVAFTQWPGAVEDWPEFGFLIGGRGANHKDSDEHVWIKLDDPQNPIPRAFNGQGFDYRDEFFRVHDTYSRGRVRVLLSIDTDKTDVNAGPPRGNCYRADNDYALAWCRNYGRGRTFYCTIAHNPYVFYDARMLKFYLAAAQFVLGDLPVPTTPSARLTPEVFELENRGWQFAIAPATPTLAEAASETSRLKQPFLSASDEQRVSEKVALRFDSTLSDAGLEGSRLNLEKHEVRLLSWHLTKTPDDEAGLRKLFGFANKMGLECLITQPAPEQIPALEKLADEYGVDVALRMQDRKYAKPEALARLLANRSPRLGICASLAEWSRNKVNPAKAVKIFGKRLRVIEFDQDAAAILQKTLPELKRVGSSPLLFLAKTTAGATASTSGTQEVIQIFNTALLKPVR